MNKFLKILILGGVLISSSLFAQGEFVTMGEYMSTLTTHGGRRGVFMGNNQDMVFVENGKIVWSSKGGWVNGGRGQSTSGSVAQIRERMRQQKADQDRAVRDGRRNPEFGEYISRGTTFHGYRGHWSGNNQSQNFVSAEYGVIYSSRGGWVTGFGPGYDRVQSRWGVGISNDANVYGGDVSDPNGFYRVNHLEANRLYMVVESGRRFVTVSYESGSSVYLSNRPLPNGAVIPGRMLGKYGKFRFVLSGNGYRFDPVR